MATLVMKFGGSLTADPRRIARIAQVTVSESQAWKRLIVVISAMAGATDALNRAIDLAMIRNAPGYRRAVATIRNDHLAIIKALFQSESARRELTNYTDRLLFDVLSSCDRIAAEREVTPRDRDAVVAVGERVMVAIIAAVMRQEGLRVAVVDAISVIVTDDHHQNANPLVDRIDERVDSVLRPLLDEGIVPLVTGFIGATQRGAVTTLGRGGSDYTATLLAASLRADEVWIWTSVDGVMSADPQLVPGARVIPELSYEEVGELSYFGAHVLHPRAVEPLLPHKIPLRVRNPFNLDHAGTLIQAESSSSEHGLKAVTAIDGLSLSTKGQSIDLNELLGQVHHVVGRVLMGPVIVMQSHLRSTLVFIVPTSEGPQAVATAAQRLTNGLGTDYWEINPVKVITVMGTVTPIVWDNSSVKPIASVWGPGERRLIAVAPADTQTIVRQLHKLANQATRV
ncbi:MAG: aspartate kinase [Anaerolineae bacterium]|nr:aspartate kinase [Anaerolineae bacterium]